MRGSRENRSHIHVRPIKGLHMYVIVLSCYTRNTKRGDGKCRRKSPVLQL